MLSVPAPWWLKIGLNNPFLAGPLKASSSCVGIQR